MGIKGLGDILKRETSMYSYVCRGAVCILYVVTCQGSNRGESKCSSGQLIAKYSAISGL